LGVIPATVDLAGAEIELVGQFARETLLRRAIDGLGATAWVLIDCPPSLGLLTVNALAAADEVLVPIQCEYFALEGLGQLLRNLRLIQQSVNRSLRLNGIVMTMYDGRTKLADQVVAEIRSYFGSQVYQTVVPRSVRLSEAPGFGMPIVRYDPSSRGAAAYRALADEFLRRQADRPEAKERMPSMPGVLDVDDEPRPEPEPRMASAPTVTDADADLRPEAPSEATPAWALDADGQPLTSRLESPSHVSAMNHNSDSSESAERRSADSGRLDDGSGGRDSEATGSTGVDADGVAAPGDQLRRPRWPFRRSREGPS
jgi:hypothetical protein